MIELKFPESIYLILAFFVPGFVTSAVRSQFISTRKHTDSQAMPRYLALSIIYYALVFPVTTWLLTINDVYFKGLVWFGIVLIGPAIFGVLLGVNAQKDLVRRLAQQLGFDTIHVMPTAWDWKFARLQEAWVLVVLKDGTQFAGYCGCGFFFSSDPNERDLYIEQVYDVGQNNEWSRQTDKGVLITYGEIRTIEFWPVTSGGDSNGEKK